MNKMLTTRRQIVGAAGATMALAACGNQTDGAKGNSASGSEGTGLSLDRLGKVPTGTWPNFGSQPTDAGPADKFNPKYVTLVWFECSDNWDISSTHASFAVKSGVNLDNFAIETFYKMHALGGKKPKFSKIENLELEQYNKKDNDDLIAFGGSSQHAIYFYFSSKSIEVLEQFEIDEKGNIKKDESGDPIMRKQIFAFSMFRSDGQFAIPNDTFFDGREIYHNNKLKGPLVGLNNYFLGENGSVIDPTDPKQTRIYSLNIYVKVRNTNKNAIVLSIDPDTGNGFGYQP